jgi:hypothetical protein
MEDAPIVKPRNRKTDGRTRGQKAASAFPAMAMGATAGVVITYLFELIMSTVVGVPIIVPTAVASAFGTLCGYTVTCIMAKGD